MKPKYIIKVKCPLCGHVDPETYRAPTRCFTGWECPNCHHVMGLSECTETHRSPDEEKIMYDIYIYRDTFKNFIHGKHVIKWRKGEATFFIEAIKRITGRSWRSRLARWLLKIKLI